ncbi:MAG: daunorubicin resistance transporter ATPase subunit [Rhodoglobus sp.]|nr:daunorubicin resistance transporter ATPase subunit [Rhodoglobus sp.]
MDHSLIATGLRKRFGQTRALDGFDLRVAPGTVHGLLGPNGAGKSTAVRVLTTLTRLEEGTATIAGIDVRRDPAGVRSRIGLVGQAAAVDEILGGEQNLVMFGRLFGLAKRAARARASQLLEQFDLAEVGSKPVSSYSGGMRRRLDIAASLILSPSVLFLDEPTTGLDPRGRNEVWRAVRQASAAGTTVLLTTQYLEEADQLADQISVMSAGRVIADGTPDSLKSDLGADVVSVVVSDPGRLAEAAGLLGRVAGAEASVDKDARAASTRATTGSAAMVEAIRALDAAGIELDDVSLRRPTLDEVFLTLTDTDTNTKETR